MFGIFGRFTSSFFREIIQRRGPECLRNPVSTGMPRAYLTITDAPVNVAVQSTSHSGPTPIKVWQNPGMICPVTRNPEGSFGKFNSPVPVDF